MAPDHRPGFARARLYIAHHVELLGSGLLTLLLATASAHADEWPSFRGPQGTGVSNDASIPLTWNAKENVAWRVPLPDRGNATPAVWGDRVFVTQAIDSEKRRTLMCFRRSDGELLWQSGVVYDKADPTNAQNPHGSASPATDGKHVIASFGSAGLFAFDFDGNELWRRDFGDVDSWHGSGSSPIIHGGLCFLNFGPGTKSALVACRVDTGEVVWKASPQAAGRGFGQLLGSFASRLGGGGPADAGRNPDGSFAFERAANTADTSGAGGFNGSWSTPVVVQAGDREELVVVHGGHVTGYEPATGRELWTCSGLPPQVFTSPAVGDGILVATGHAIPSGTQLLAVRLGGSGDVTGTHRLWQANLPKDCIGSGVIAADSLFLMAENGIAICLDLDTGEKRWEKRLRGQGRSGGAWSSLVLVGDKILVTNHSSETFVIRASPEFELLHTNPTEEETTCASLAISDGQLFLRTYESLWCIGQGEE
ncbi:MAG: PQQ-binding-like beta-propeller repeat protein [Pirellulales bacterium]